jgi:hypothetical protein
MPMLDQEIRRLVEFYIGDCLGYGPKELCGWWSDGVIHLEIINPSSDQFKLIGVTWIDSHGITPFEIDIDLDPAEQAIPGGWITHHDASSRMNCK